MIVVPLSLLALGFPTTLVSPTGLLWLMALGGGIGFRISWSIDKKGMSGPQRVGTPRSSDSTAVIDSPHVARGSGPPG